MEREKSHNNYKSSADFRETTRPHTIETPHGGATITAEDDSFTSAIEYALALEEKDHTQAECIIELKASVDGQTVLTESTNYTETAVTTGGAKKDLKNLRAMMKQLTYSITNQDATLVAISISTNSGGGGRKNTEKKKSLPGLHVCAHCKK